MGRKEVHPEDVLSQTPHKETQHAWYGAHDLYKFVFPLPFLMHVQVIVHPTGPGTRRGREGKLGSGFPEHIFCLKTRADL